jgi:hypothetical protein
LGKCRLRQSCGLSGLSDLLGDPKALEFGLVLLSEFWIVEFFLEGSTEWGASSHGSTPL